MNKKILIVMIGLMLSSISSLAGVLVEPFLGYHSGTTEYKLLDSFGGASGSGTSTGGYYGLGLGYKFPFKLLIGLDYAMGALDTKSGAAGVKIKWNQTDTFLTLAYQIDPKGHIGIGYGTVNITDDSDPKTKYTGTALKTFLGYEFKNHIAINVEYILYTLSEFTVEGFPAIKFADSYSKFNYTASVISFSFPFEFGK